GGVAGRSRQLFAVRAEGDRNEGPQARLQPVNFPAPFQVPDVNRPISSRRCQSRPAWVERHALDLVRVPVQAGNLPAGDDVPNADLVRGWGGQWRAVGDENEVLAPASKGAYALSRSDVP